MQKRGLATTYAVFCTLLMVAGFVVAFSFAWLAGTRQTVGVIAGMFVSFMLTPVLHEMGHVAFGQAVGMECVYCKCFCFKVYVKRGKRRLGFASPFAADQTQMLPKRGGNMAKRARLYTLGGLLMGGGYLAVLLAGAIVCSALDEPRFFLWGCVPYAGYLFFLNLPPLEYASGKTDGAVARGIRKGAPAEKCMLAAMEIQGRLAEGKRFGEIEKSLYFELPQLAEDEPMFAVLLDLRYRYYLDIEDVARAADCLNRLAQAQEYLPDSEVEKIAAELVYVHSLYGDLERAEACGKLCTTFLQEESASAKRILAAFSLACGKVEAVEPLKAQARIALEYERIAGVKKWEENLLERIKSST